MSTSIPPVGTPAHQAMLAQGSDMYPGVDEWTHPKKGLPAGTLLLQFDHRDADVIQQSPVPASVFFTDAGTFMKYLTDKQVQAQGLAEALQVRPYRTDPESPHLYGQNVAIYTLQRELRAGQVQEANPTEFGEGSTRNNLHWGEGVGKQYFIAIPKDEIREGSDSPLKLSAVVPCSHRAHRLDWLKELEQTKQPDQAVIEAIAKAFESRVEKLLQGTLPQQQHGQQIAELQQVRRSFDSVPTPPSLTQQLKPETTPAGRKPRGPRL